MQTEWEVGSIRFTLFPAPAEDVLSPDWWGTVFDSDPEQFVRQAKQNIQQEATIFEEGVLYLDRKLDRVDWRYDIPNNEVNKISLGHLEPTLDLFQNVIRRWFDSSLMPSATRLALGLRLIIPSETGELAYSKLSEYLPFTLDKENTSDFLLQINKPTSTETKQGDELEVNRLSKWSVTRYGLTQFTVSSSHVQHDLSTEGYYCQVELDINTSPNFPGEFDPENIRHLFDELRNQGVGIANEGIK